MTAEPDPTFAQLLRQARREAGLTQEELAEQVRWERTRRRLATRSGSASGTSGADYDQPLVAQRTIAIAPPIGRPDLEQFG